MHRQTIGRAVALVCGMLLALWGGRAADQPSVVTGTIVDFRAGGVISIASDQVEPVPLELREATKYEDQQLRTLTELSSIRPGTRAMVWYRNVGERRLVVDRVRVLERAGG